MSTYSFHNFIFPFQWKIRSFGHKPFSEQIDLNNIDYALSSNWERTHCGQNEKEQDDLYNERNYFYEFVHDALYDNGRSDSLIRHYERNEPKHGEVSYVIQAKGKTYTLKVSAINLDLYSTGVGTLSFFLHNEHYPAPEDVLRINQVGRRVFPPFIGDVNIRSLIADSIEITGLHGRVQGYREDFSRYTNQTSANQPAAFISDLIHEVAKNIELKPVIDDRMFVQCWYKNDEWAGQFSGDGYERFRDSNQWYEFVFVDDLGGLTCQNREMQERLIREATYERWQQYSSLYSVSRYSMMLCTSSECPIYLINYFETMYARMAELILVQKASVLRFSAEVTNISNMEVRKGFGEKVNSLYKEYIRFVNQIHFREVSAQDQGIELYEKMYGILNIKEHVEKLDAEIEELYNFVSLREDRKSNDTISLLTWVATIAVPITVVSAIFGMNNVELTGDPCNPGALNKMWLQLALTFIITLITIILVLTKTHKRK